MWGAWHFGDAGLEFAPACWVYRTLRTCGVLRCCLIRPRGAQVRRLLDEWHCRPMAVRTRLRPGPGRRELHVHDYRPTARPAGPAASNALGAARGPAAVCAGPSARDDAERRAPTTAPNPASFSVARAGVCRQHARAPLGRLLKLPAGAKETISSQLRSARMSSGWTWPRASTC